MARRICEFFNYDAVEACDFDAGPEWDTWTTQPSAGSAPPPADMVVPAHNTVGNPGNDDPWINPEPVPFPPAASDVQDVWADMTETSVIPEGASSGLTLRRFTPVGPADDNPSDPAQDAPSPVRAPLTLQHFG